MPYVRRIVLWACMSLVIVLGLTTWSFRKQAQALQLALVAQNGAVLQQNLAAAALLKQRTAERDALQQNLNERAALQEKIDEKALAQIASDDELHRSRTVRIRLWDGSCRSRSGGGSPAGGSAGSPNAGPADASSTSGVLSEAGAGRLASALTEVEQMSAAYGSCRSQLMLQK